MSFSTTMNLPNSCFWQARKSWPRSFGSPANTPRASLGRSRVRIHVAESDAPQEWEQGKSVNFNGADWVIDARRACAGLVTFDLSIEQGGDAGW